MNFQGMRTRLLELLRENSFKQGHFVLASGKESDFFIDCKQTVLTAEGHLTAALALWDALRQMPPCEAVAGVELGGCPLASAVSLCSWWFRANADLPRELPALYVRKVQKDHGTSKLVEGAVQPGISVVLLEDVITTGGSSLRAVDSLRLAGVQVVGILALVDRLEGGREAINATGMLVETLFDRHDFIPEP